MRALHARLLGWACFRVESCWATGLASAKVRGQGISRMLCRSRGLHHKMSARAGLRPWPWASLPPYGSWAFSCWRYQNLANPYLSRSRRYCSLPGWLSLSLAWFACCPSFCHCTPSLFYHCQNILLKCKSDHVSLLKCDSVFHSFRKISGHMASVDLLPAAFHFSAR